MSRLYSKGHISFISVLLILTFISLQVAPSYSAQGYIPGGTYHLSPQTVVFDSLVSDTINEKAMFETIINFKAKSDTALDFSREQPIEGGTGNLFTAFKDKTVEVFFNGTIRLQDLFDELTENIFIIPGQVGNDEYFASVICDNEGVIQSSAVYRVEEFEKYCDSLIVQGRFLTKLVDHFKQRLEASYTQGDTRISFVDVTDRGITSVEIFLNKLDAVNMSADISRGAENKKIILTNMPVIFPGSMVVTESEDTFLRAKQILENTLNENGLSYDEITAAFEAFWQAWESGEADGFNPDSFIEPSIRLDIATADEQTSNEGGLSFLNQAYEKMIYLGMVGLEECESTIEDIKRIFKHVAIHDLPPQFGIVYVVYDKMKQAIEKDELEKAGELNREIREKSEADGIDYIACFESMPGINSDMIVVEDLSKCLLPTDVVTRDGTIRIHENFVKMMELLKTKGLDEYNGEIHEFPLGQDPQMLGELYSSIIYSVAIHTLRGHLPVDSLTGLMEFQAKEEIAQGERGYSHNYVNVLAMLFYWIVVVERHEHPQERAEFFIDKNPQVFSRLTTWEKKNLADHLAMLATQLSRKGVWDTGFSWDETGTTKEEVERELHERYSDFVSNEGEGEFQSDIERESWTHVNPAGVFQALFKGTEAMTLDKIAEKIGTTDAGMIDDCLDVLLEGGVISEVVLSGRNIKAYKAKQMTRRKANRVAAILEGIQQDTDLKDVKGEIFKITQRKWAHTLRYNLVRSGRPERIKAEDGKIILAVETDPWVPGSQKDYVQTLVQDLEKLNEDERKTVRIIRGTKAELAAKLQKAIEEEKAPLKNVVILADQKTLTQEEYFKKMLEMDNSQEDRPFLAGVNASELEEDSYVRLLEMITMAVRMAFDQDPMSDHAEIRVSPFNEINSRAVIFTPEAEPLNLQHLKEIYDIQRRIATRA